MNRIYLYILLKNIMKKTIFLALSMYLSWELPSQVQSSPLQERNPPGPRFENQYLEMNSPQQEKIRERFVAWRNRINSRDHREIQNFLRKQWRNSKQEQELSLRQRIARSRSRVPNSQKAVQQRDPLDQQKKLPAERFIIPVVKTSEPKFEVSNDNIVHGKPNHIVNGQKNFVKGRCNQIENGDENVIKGSYNKIQNGNDNRVQGKGNFIAGNSNIISNNNDIKGRSNFVVGHSNIINNEH